MNFAPGDDEILWALMEYRVLTSGQLAWLTGRSAAVIRRRIRKHLASEWNVVRLLLGGSTDQNAYALSGEGFKMMAARAGLDPSRMPFSIKPPAGPGSPFFRHMKLSNDVWIFFRRACQNAGSPIELARAVPEWEMNPDPTKRRSKKPWERFVISERLQDIEDAQLIHVLRPDLVLVFAVKDQPGLRVASYLEADRATVSVRGVIVEKIRAYWHLFLRRGFEHYGAVAMRVLFVVGDTRTEQRIRSVQDALGDFCRSHELHHERFRQQRLQAAAPQARDHLAARMPPITAFSDCFRFARREDLSGVDILREPVWQDASAQRLPFFRGNGSAMQTDDSQSGTLSLVRTDADEQEAAQ
jgi:hypothetical protein